MRTWYALASALFIVSSVLARAEAPNPQPKASQETKFPKIYVTGSVTSPGGYAYEEGMTVERAIDLAGGVTPRGSTSGLTIKRIVEERPVTLNATPSSVLQGGDVVQVPRKQPEAP
jgi:protein involved in polysaccharide export with SLBB domain